MFVSRGLRLVMLIGLFSLWSVPPALADDDGFEVNVPAGFSGPLLLKDGRLLAVDRIGISGLISTDGGRTWQKSGRLADRGGPGGRQRGRRGQRPADLRPGNRPGRGYRSGRFPTRAAPPPPPQSLRRATLRQHLGRRCRRDGRPTARYGPAT